MKRGRRIRRKLFLISSIIILSFLLLLPPSAWAAVGGDTQYESQGTRSASSPLYLLTYDHGGLVLWGHEHFVEHLRGAIAWLDQYPSFKIGLDNEAYTYDQLAQDNPQALKEIRQYLKVYAGRFGIGTCTYGQPLSVFINEESNIRQVGYALDADRKHLGCAPSVYLMSEHAMHSQMPQILNGFGFTGAIMRTHYMMYGYNPTFDAAVGWWVGLDGSRIPAIPTYRGEGAEFGKTTVDNWILTRYPGSNAPKSPADFRDDFAHIRPLLATRADDAGLRREELVKEYEGKPGYEWILLEEIFGIFPAPGAEFRTVPNDFVVRMPWGYCGNEIWNQCRAAEVAVLTAERIAALELACGGADRQGQLQQAWKSLLVAQHHDIQICGLLADARKFLPASIGVSACVMDASLRYIASRMAGGQVAQVTVFNPLSWPRRGWVTVGLSLPRGAAGSLEVRQADKVIPSAVLAPDLHSDGSLRDICLTLYADLPALSVASYALVPTEKRTSIQDNELVVDSDNLTISSPHWVVRLGEHGGISSMKDTGAKRELIQSARRSAFFAGSIDGKELESRGVWNIQPARNETPWVTARENGFIGSIPYMMEMIFRADTPRIDCRVQFHFDGQRIGRLSENKRDSASGFIHEEKLRFKVFPAVGDAATAVRDLPFAVGETSDRYVNGLYWAAMTDNEKGVAFFNRGTMGAVRESDGGFSMPLAYAMYYVWGTRMLHGEFTYEFAIYPFTGQWNQADLHRQALEYNYPLVGLGTAPGDARFGYVLQPIDIRSPDILLSALYSDNGDIYLRMYEHRGSDGQVLLDYTLSEARLTEVDLAGRESSLTTSPLQFRPWQIKTVRIEPLGK